MANRVGVFTRFLFCALLMLVLWATSGFAEPPVQQGESFPRTLQSYEEVDGIWATLGARISAEPFNLAATLLRQGDLVDARDLFEQVLEASTRTLGPEHPYTLGARDALAYTLAELDEAS